MTNGSAYQDECLVEPDPMCPQDLAEFTRKAIHPFRVVPRFTQFWSQFTDVMEEVEGPTHYNAGITPISGTCWFSPEGYAIGRTWANNVLALSSLVLTFSLPLAYNPGTNSPANALFNAFKEAHVDRDPTSPTVNRYSDLPGFMDLLRDVCAGGNIASHFDFYIEVTRPNGCTFSYRAQLMGMELETGMALYKVRKADPWNRDLDPIKLQKVLEWGVSREAVSGSPSYCQYNSRVSGPNTFSTGTIQKARTSVPDGSITIELITATNHIDHGGEGAPLMNGAAEVIGQVIGVTDNGTVVAVASSFLLRIYNALKDVICKKKCNDMVVNLDVFGCFIYQHGSLGSLVYHAKTSIDLNQALLVNAVNANECNNCGSDAYGGNACGCGNGDGYWSHRDYVGNNNDMDRGIYGYVLSQDPCGPLGETAEECVITDPNLSDVRRRFYLVRRGDWITHLDGIPVGDEDGQRSIDDYLFGLEQGCIVRVTFKKQSQRYNFEHNVNVCLVSSIAFVPTFRPCCVPCLSSEIPGLCWGNGGSIVPVTETQGEVVQQAANLLHLLSCWFGLLRWTSNTLSQVYRACLFSNMELIMTRLNEMMSVFIQYKPAGANNPAVLPFPFNSLPPELALAVPTPVSMKLVMAQISRTVISAIAIPSMKCAVQPITFYDYTASIPHPNSACSFEKTVPLYLKGIGSVLNAWTEAYTPIVPVPPPVLRTAAPATVPKAASNVNFGVTKEAIESQIRKKAVDKKRKLEEEVPVDAKAAKVV